VDVTDRLVQEGEDMRREEEQAKAARHEAGAAALLGKAQAAWLRGMSLTFNEDAVPLLVGLGIAREDARRLIWDRDGRDWHIAGDGHKGNPRVLKDPASQESAAGIHKQRELPLESRPEATAIPAPVGTQGLQESTDAEPLEQPRESRSNLNLPIPAELSPTKGGESARHNVREHSGAPGTAPGELALPDLPERHA
jgi:hypothetical protein